MLEHLDICWGERERKKRTLTQISHLTQKLTSNGSQLNVNYKTKYPLEINIAENLWDLRLDKVFLHWTLKI